MIKDNSGDNSEFLDITQNIVCKEANFSKTRENVYNTISLFIKVFVVIMIIL